MLSIIFHTQTKKEYTSTIKVKKNKQGTFLVFHQCKPYCRNYHAWPLQTLTSLPSPLQPTHTQTHAHARTRTHTYTHTRIEREKHTDTHIHAQAIYCNSIPTELVLECNNHTVTLAQHCNYFVAIELSTLRHRCQSLTQLTKPEVNIANGTRLTVHTLLSNCMVAAHTTHSMSNWDKSIFVHKQSRRKRPTFN